MNRRDVLKAAGLFGAGASTGTVLDSSMSFDSNPAVVFEGGTDKFSLVEKSSDASQAGAMVNGNAVLQNKTGDSIHGEFQTYFIGKLDGENYGFQGSTEVQQFGKGSTEEISVKTELQGDDDFELKEYLVVFIQER